MLTNVWKVHPTDLKQTLIISDSSQRSVWQVLWKATQILQDVAECWGGQPICERLMLEAWSWFRKEPCIVKKWRMWLDIVKSIADSPYLENPSWHPRNLRRRCLRQEKPRERDQTQSSTNGYQVRLINSKLLQFVLSSWIAQSELEDCTEVPKRVVLSDWSLPLSSFI